jgi:putative DNA primase/helicase
MIDLNDAPEQHEAQAVAQTPRKGRVSEAALRSLNGRAVEIARALLGMENPTLSSVDELRWGANGSVSVQIAGAKAGAYYNFERKVGGGLMQMLAIEGGMAAAAATDWLRDTLGIELGREKPTEPQRRVATWDYQDEQGAPLYRVTRWAPRKTFTQSKADGNGGWLEHKGCMDGVRLVPYRLPELLASDDATVFVAEGEKCVEALRALGFIATCNPGGAGKWPAEFRDHFAGRTVIILPDNDKPGIDHAALVARSLAGAARVQVLPLPGLGPKEDVADWFAAGGTREALEALVAEALVAEAPSVEAPVGDAVDTEAPYLIARLFIARNYTSGCAMTLRHHREMFFAWSGSAYREISDDTLRAQLYAYLDLCTELDDRGKATPVKPDRQLVGNVLDALRAVAHLGDTTAAPCWLDGGGSGVPVEELIACTNGLLHLPTLRLLPHSPLLFTLNALEFGFDASAPEPVEWLRFLDELWGSDPASIETLQEIFGLMLTGDTRFQKAFLLIGPPRSGKGTIARVLTQLIGRANAVSPVLSSLEKEFGLAPLLGKRLAVIPDARLSGRVDQVAIAERVLSITGEDMLTIPRKYREAWTGTLQVRLVILSNELPGIADASGALASRFVILVLQQSFLGREDNELTGRLLQELPGILNWGVEGLKRLYKRGYFVQPESANEISQDFADLGSPISSFLRDRCELGNGYTASIDDVYKVWCWWCEEQGRDKPGTKQIFGRNLRAVMPGLHLTRPRDDNGAQKRMYEGIRIKPVTQAKPRGVDLNDAPLQRDEERKEPWWVH